MTIATKSIKLSLVKDVLAKSNLRAYRLPEELPNDSLSIDFYDGQADAQVFLVALCMEVCKTYDRATAITFAEDAVLTIFNSSSRLHAPRWKTVED